MERFVSVDLFVGSPEKTLKLCKKISARHTLLGADSPLTGVLDMAAFESRRAAALQLFDDSNESRETKEKWHSKLTKACGISEGQNKQSEKTLYWYVLQVRDVLLPINRLEEQGLEEYGYHVVVSQTGGRRTVRIDIPRDNPETLVELCEAILAQHTELGADSPLTASLDMDDFGTKTTAARQLFTDWDAERAARETKHNQALHLIGYSEGQSSQTANTLYFDLITIRDRLLQVMQGEEQGMEEWGFKVVIHSKHTAAKTGGGQTTILEISNLGMGTIANFNLTGIDLQPTMTITLEALNSPGRFYAAPTAVSGPGVGAVLNVVVGTPVTKTIAQLMSELGFSDTNEFLNVQNTGAVIGTYRITITTP